MNLSPLKKISINIYARWLQLIIHINRVDRWSEKETTKNFCFENSCCSEGKTGANWTRRRTPSHCYSNLTSEKNSRGRKRAWAQISQTQIQNTAQRGGNLFSAVLGLARPLIKPALGALASASLSFGAEKGLKKIFGKGFGPKEIELYKLVQKMTPAQKKAAERYLVGEGVVKGGSAQ